MRSTNSAVTALERLAGRRTQAGGAGTPPTVSCDAVMSPSGGLVKRQRRVYVTVLTVIRHTSYLSAEAASPQPISESEQAMKLRVFIPVLMVAGLALAGCGSAAQTESPAEESQQKPQKLVVWDWKSGEPTAAEYIEKAKADFAKRHPGVTVEFVAQPFDQYYTLLGTAIQTGKGPDVMLFNGGGQIRDRVDALLPLDQYVAEDKSRLAGWDAFTKDGKIYAAPVTLQGHPIYYNKALYEEAGLDPANPPKTWDEFVSGCAAIKKATEASCFALGNKEGAGIQFFMSGLGSGILTPRSTTTGSPGSATGPPPT